MTEKFFKSLTKIHSEPHCPDCGHLLDGASSEDPNARPSEGCPAVCINCSTILIFNRDLSLRVATKKDLDEFHPETRKIIEQYSRAVKQLDRRHL